MRLSKRRGQKGWAPNFAQRTQLWWDRTLVCSKDSGAQRCWGDARVLAT